MPLNINVNLDYASPTEAVKVAKLFREILAELPYYNDIAKRDEAKKYSPANLRKMVKKDKYSVLIAKNGNEIIGFCFSYFDDYTIWIDWLGVKKEERRKGIGEALLNAVIADANKRTAHKVWCDTRNNNETSKRLLTKLGFRIIAELKNHWYGLDFILWELPV